MAVARHTFNIENYRLSIFHFTQDVILRIKTTVFNLLVKHQIYYTFYTRDLNLRKVNVFYGDLILCLNLVHLLACLLRKRHPLLIAHTLRHFTLNVLF